MSATAVAEEAVQEFAVTQVLVSELNTRQPTAKDVQELVETIRAAGQITPCLARPHPKKKGCYELAAGARRRTACEVLGIPVKVIVREMDDATFEDVILIENLQREDPDPMAEATLIKRRLDEKVPPAEIAARYGKSVMWVARRMKLLTLLPAAVKEARSGEMMHFTTQMLECFGALPEDTQKELLRDTWRLRQARTMKGFQEALDRMSCSLKGAGKWLKDPASFVEGCGPGCATDSQAGLFADEGKGACGNCLRPSCFKKREALAVDAAIEKALAGEAISKVIVFRTEYGQNLSYKGKELKVLEYYNFEDHYKIVETAKDDALIGLNVTKPCSAVKVFLAAKGKGKKVSAGGAAGGSNGPTESREDKLTGKRLAEMNGRLKEAIEKAAVPTHVPLLRIVAAYGTSTSNTSCHSCQDHATAKRSLESTDKVPGLGYAARDKSATPEQVIWDSVKSVLRQRLDFHRNIDLCIPWKRGDMELLASLVSFDWAAAWTEVCTSVVPVPKSWGAGIDPITLKGATIAKKAAKTPAKKVPVKVAKKAAKKVPVKAETPAPKKTAKKAAGGKKGAK